MGVNNAHLFYKKSRKADCDILINEANQIKMIVMKTTLYYEGPILIVSPWLSWWLLIDGDNDYYSTIILTLQRNFLFFFNQVNVQGFSNILKLNPLISNTTPRKNGFTTKSQFCQLTWTVWTFLCLPTLNRVKDINNSLRKIPFDNNKSVLKLFKLLLKVIIFKTVWVYSLALGRIYPSRQKLLRLKKKVNLYTI